MDGKRFDRVVRGLPAETRRGLLRLLAALAGIFPLLAADESEAGKGGRRRGGKHHGRNRPRRRHARRRHKHKHKKHKNKKKPQEQCSPQTPDGPCVGDQLCIDGACQPCTVTCDGDSGACGDALRAAIDAAAADDAGPIVVCPGRYGGNFEIGAGVQIIGAGDGDDPSRDTILDAQGEGRVLLIRSDSAGDVTLERLRLTGGGGNNGIGGGIWNRGRTLTMSGCTVSGNTTANPGLGGGIANDGTLTLSDCRIEDNSAASQGGGIFVNAGTVTIDAGCQVTGNTAPDGAGGGIFLVAAGGGTVSLENDQIVTDNNGGNCAGEDIDNCDG